MTGRDHETGNCLICLQKSNRNSLHRKTIVLFVHELISFSCYERISKVKTEKIVLLFFLRLIPLNIVFIKKKLQFESMRSIFLLCWNLKFIDKLQVFVCDQTSFINLKMITLSARFYKIETWWNKMTLIIHVVKRKYQVKVTEALLYIVKCQSPKILREFTLDSVFIN